MSGALAILPSALSGGVSAPPSKSIAHRAVIAAALARGRSTISNLDLSQDIEATVGAVRALGARVELSKAQDGTYVAAIDGITASPDMPHIDCGESGSTLRFMIPVALAACGGAVFTGSARLGQRPIWPYLDIFKKQGISAEFTNQGLPLRMEGRLKPGEFVIPGGVSSQFVTGLMMAIPLLDGNSDIRIYDGCLESVGYVDITMDVLHSFKVEAEEVRMGEWYCVAGNQRYTAGSYSVEGDWSQAAFLLLMGLLSGPVSVGGLNRESKQGDRVVEDIFRSMGGELRWEGGRLAAGRSRLHGAAVDVSQRPDLAPAIAAAMAAAEGESRITGGARLRVKESDRIASIAACLKALGADARETEDGLVICGRGSLPGGEASSCNDHRIAMMAAAISPACAGPVVLSGPEAVAKSWPGFWEDFRSLGGSFHEQPVG